MLHAGQPANRKKISAASPFAVSPWRVSWRPSTSISVKCPVGVEAIDQFPPLIDIDLQSGRIPGPHAFFVQRSQLRP